MEISIQILCSLARIRRTGLAYQKAHRARTAVVLYVEAPKWEFTAHCIWSYRSHLHTYMNDKFHFKFIRF